VSVIQFPNDPAQVIVGWEINNKSGEASVYIIQNNKKIEMFPLYALEVLRELAGVIIDAEYHNKDGGFDPRTVA
jgi:hypothetical protein